MTIKFIKTALTMVLAAALTASSLSARTLTVTDAATGQPVAGATLFSSKGAIITITGESGQTEEIPQECFPVTVRCLGYSPVEIGPDESAAGLQPVSFELGEVTVSPADRPVSRLLCNIREFVSTSNSTDTLQAYTEYMADFFLPAEGTKKFKARRSPRVLASETYRLQTSADGTDSLSRVDDTGDIWLELLEIRDEKTGGKSRTDSVAGKHSGFSRIVRRTPGLYIVDSDFLADKKGHTWSPAFFKFLGMTMDVNRMTTSWGFRKNSADIYRTADLVFGTLNMEVKGRGKWIKKAFKSDEPVDIQIYFEIYPVEVSSLTVDEANAMLSERNPSEPMRRSVHAQPLPPGISRIVERCREIRQ